jgi:hypothetical protein
VISSASSEFISTDLPKASKELDPEFHRIVQAERSDDPNDEEPYRFGIGIRFLWIVRFQALVSWRVSAACPIAIHHQRLFPKRKSVFQPRSLTSAADKQNWKTIVDGFS